MIGRILNDGRLTGRIKYDINDMASVKLQTQLTQEKGYSQMMVDLDLKVSVPSVLTVHANLGSACRPDGLSAFPKFVCHSRLMLCHCICLAHSWQGSDWNGQLKMGNTAFYGERQIPWACHARHTACPTVIL